jgi:hypothetical protein
MSKETFDALPTEQRRALTWQAIRTLHDLLNDPEPLSARSQEMRNAMLDDPARYIREVTENLSEFSDAIRDTSEHFRLVRHGNLKSSPRR